MSEWIEGTIRLDRTYFLTDEQLAVIKADGQCEIAFNLDQSGWDVAEFDEEIERYDTNTRTDVYVDGEQIY